MGKYVQYMNLIKKYTGTFAISQYTKLLFKRNSKIMRYIKESEMS